MICGAFQASIGVIQRQRDIKEWRLRPAATDGGGGQVLFANDEECPPKREAAVRFPGSSGLGLSRRQGTGGQADAGAAR